MTEVQVNKLNGQVWAINAQGERQLLQEDDLIDAQDMVIADVGASVELDFGDGAILTFQGDQSTPLLEELLAFQDSGLPPRQPRPGAAPDAQEPQGSQDSQQGSGSTSQSNISMEGNFFVQLVRIGDVIESDGFTPVAVKRIEEILRPLGMSYPDRSLSYEEERENLHLPNHDAWQYVELNNPPQAVGTIGNQKNNDADTNISVSLDLPSLFQDVDGDELTYSITGLPKGLTFDPLTGEITGTIDNSASQDGNNGVHTVTVTATDPQGATGSHTFTWTVENPEPEANSDSGETLKSTRLTVDAEKGVLHNDHDPDGDDLAVVSVQNSGGQSGTVNAEGALVIKSDKGTLELKQDGSYVYTPDLNNETVWKLGADDTPLVDTFTYTVSDGEGGTNTADLVITIHGHSNRPPFLTPQDHNDDGANSIDGHVTVHEKGLDDGTDPGVGHIAEGVIQISAMDGLKEIVIAGESVDLDTLMELSSGQGGPIVINSVDGGIITLTGFDPLIITTLGVDKVLGGDLHYTYELTDDQDHPAADGNNSFLLDIQLGVKDDQNADSIDANNKLVVNVIDDVPAAKDIDAGGLVEDGGENTLSGDVTDKATTGNIFGADGDHDTAAVSWGGVSASLNGDTVSLDDYGSIVQGADGKWSFTLDNAKPAAQALNDNDQIVVTMPYTLQDKDSDTAAAEVTFVITGVNDDVTITVPDPNDNNDPNYPTVADPQDPNDPTRGEVDDLVVFESGLSNGSDPDNDDIKVESSFTISALDGLADTDALILSVDGKEIRLGKTAIEDLSTTTPSAELETSYGKLKLTGYTPNADGTITIEYEYILTDAPDNTEAGHTPEHAFDRISITAKDRDGDDDEQTLSIKIIDDAPVAEDDANSVSEGADLDDTGSIASGNVIGTGGATAPFEDDEADTAGADGAKVTEIQLGTDPSTQITVTGGGVQIKGEYGTLTIQPDGSYTYQLDNSNLDVQGLNGEAGETPLTDVFTYTLTDGDNDSDDAKLTITITGSNDLVTITVPNPGDPDDPDSPADETAYPDDPQDSNITDLVVFESGLATGSEGNGTDAVDELVTVKSSFTISALDGLDEDTALTIGGQVFTKADLADLSDSEPSAAITTAYGELKLTGYELIDDPNDLAHGTVRIDYEYTLTSAPDNTDAGYTDEHAFDNISITAKDRDGDDDEQTLVIKIIDDAPKIAVDGDSVGSLTVDETNFDNDGKVTATNTNFVTGVFGVTAGADGATTTYSLEVSDGTDSGLKDTASGETIYLYQNGNAIDGRVGDDTGDVAFKIEIDSSNGEVTLTQQRPVQHPDETNPDDGVTLNADSIQLYATATDGDNDTVKSAGVSVGGKFVFKDDGPTLDDTNIESGVFTDSAVVHEKHLPSGSDSNAPALTVTKDLPINYGSDGAVNSEGKTGLVFTDTNTTALQALNLKSGGAKLSYELSTDGHTITAKAGTNDIFEIVLSVATDGTPGYSFTLKGPLDHQLVKGSEDKETYPDIELPFSITATDGDGDSVALDFKVLVTDDTPPAEDRDLEVDEDGSVSFSNADVNQTTTELKEGAEPSHGTVTIGNDGTITYKPNTDYRGEDSFTYTVSVAEARYERTVNITVKPVADKPLFENDKGEQVAAYDYKVETPEDTEVSLGLKLPVIKDTGKQGEAEPGYEDYPELLGAITLTPSGAGYFSGQTEQADNTRFFTKIDGVETELKPVDGKITIVIVDDAGEPVADYHVSDIKTQHPKGTEGTYYLTEAEYQAITAHPAEDHHENFEVVVKVSSYEVDAEGKPLPDDKVGDGNGGINGAESKQTITVDVLAVTDTPELGLIAPADPATAGAVTLTVTPAAGNKPGQVAAAINEDTTLNLQEVLGESFKDLDGSEQFWYEVSGLPKDTVVSINGHNYTVGASGKIEMPTGRYMTVEGTPNPSFTIRPPLNYSNADPIKATITLKVRDRDGDSTTSPDTESVSVGLELRVYAIPDDVLLEGSSTTEDTAVAFLSSLALTDTDGSESITQIRIPALPTEGGAWKMFDHNGVALTTFPAVITVGTGGGEYTLDQIKQFKLLPPGHSSLDGTIKVYITTTESAANTQSDTEENQEFEHELSITVTPVAETTDDDSNSAGGNDVTINGDHVYSTAGEEDEWFKLGEEDLGEEAGFKLSDGWSNEDGTWVRDESGNWSKETSGGRSEDTFALLTPYKTVGNSAQASAGLDGQLEGSVFTYFDGTNTITIPFAGEPVQIPMQYLDSIEFKGPKDWAGVVKVKVEAGTIDYDEDSPNAATKMAVSGEAWLTNLIIEPRADQVTLKVDAIIKTDEDVPVTLNINPTSSDPNETFDITISGIPLGATITYWEDGEEKTFTATSDNTELGIKGFDVNNQPELTPPLDSNEPISLEVTAQSVDTLEYIDKDGFPQRIEHRDADKTHTLPITIEVQGVPDEPSVELDQNKVYVEDGGDQASTEPLKVPLNELVTSIESGEIGVEGTEEARQPDDSETVTVRISDLPEGFSLAGAGPTLGGTGTDRVWVVSADNLDDVKIILPPHYSGTVKFTVQPVVTENDNPSEMYFDKQNVSFKVNPVPEATLSITSGLTEDEVGALNLTPVLAGDTDEYISAVRIAVADVPEGVSFYSDAEGNQSVNATGDYYEFSAPLQVYVKGPANYSGDVKLQLEYQVTDPSQDPQEMSNRVEGVTSGWKEIWHTLQIKPVTDAIEMELEEATGANVTTSDGVTTLTGPGTVTLQLNIDQQNDADGRDIDGSEQLTHILIDGVPEGVIVQGAINTAEGQWLLPVENAFFKEEAGNPTGHLSKELTFVVGGYAANFTEEDIRITAYSRDTGAQEHETATLDWKFTFTQEGDPADNDLPLVKVADKDYTGTEDTPFSLADAVGGTIESGHTGEYSITVSVRTALDDETDFAGMTLTEVEENGQTIKLWTATVEVGTSDTGQGKLDELLKSIQVKTAEHANSNNLSDDGLKLDVNIAVHAEGISRDARIEELAVPITPVTDTFTVGVSTKSVGEGEDIPLVITLPGNHVDGDLNGTGEHFWTIEGGVVYVHIADGGLVGQLTDASGQPLTQFTGDRPTGTPIGGSLYAVAQSDLNGLKFVPDAENHAYQTGTLAVTVLVESKENGADKTVISTGTGSLTIHHSNSGYTAEITATGDEFQGQSTDQLIQLNLANEQLVDGAEAISSAFISGLPSGFTVWLNETTMANNAGEGTWAIPVADGAKSLPQVYIKPPKNWSGTLDSLKLTVMSGHAGLEPTASEIPFTLEVAPRADGIELNPTLSFGEAAAKIALNLNASMKDPVTATGATGDQHTERTTLELSGFPDGQKVQFYIGDTLLTSPQASFDNGTWTLTGLSQAELDQLSFVHGETNGDQTVTVKAWTYEVDADGVQVGAASEPVNGTVEINVTPTVASSGDDLFLWEGKEINGFAGDDTIQLRFGESLDGDTLAANLSNIEIIDMRGEGTGENKITGLSVEDVFDMTDAGNTLQILGDAEDSVELSGESWNQVSKNEETGITTYTGTYNGNNVTLEVQSTLID